MSEHRYDENGEAYMTMDELRRYAQNACDPMERAATQVWVDLMDGDDLTATRAALQISIAMADASIKQHEVELAGGLWTTYVIYALGTGTLPDGAPVKAGRIIYAGRTRDLEKREKLHRQEAQRTPPRYLIARAIKCLREQGIEVYFHAVAEDIPLPRAKRAEAALIASLLKKGHPLQNSQLTGGRTSAVE